jgi:hypothetical protein
MVRTCLKVYGAWLLFFVSARTNKRHHHHLTNKHGRVCYMLRATRCTEILVPKQAYRFRTGAKLCCPCPSSRHPHGPDNTIPWHTDWFSTADLGGSGNGYCEICDQGTGRCPVIICDQCECTYHADCLGDSSPGDEPGFICPKCTDTLEEITNLRLREHRPSPPPWERHATPFRMLDPPTLPECPHCDLPLTGLITSPPPGGYVVVQKDPIEFMNHWHGSLISISEGVSQSGDHMHPF